MIVKVFNMFFSLDLVRNLAVPISISLVKPCLMLENFKLGIPFHLS